MLKEGMFIQERYEIISKIGSGGMADVYKAKDHKLNRFVAVKVLKREFREDKAFISKFRVEAQSAAGLAHPNIVNVYDVGDDKGIYFIVMELVEGITLKEYIEKKGRLAVREATSIAIQVSMGLEAAHRNNIVHRDVKPQNIIISTDGKVKVTDFGIARAATSNTINSDVMGSVHYSSPEQARGGYSDFKGDIYSLGITMYEMLTGTVPFDGDTTVAIAIKHLQEEMQSPRKYVADLPKSTVQIIYKCTQKSPDRRYADMEELIRDLKESLVNPEGDFVQILPLANHAQTVVISKEELEQIKQSRGEEFPEGMNGHPDRNYGNYTNTGSNSHYGGGGYDPEDEDEEGEVNRKLEKFMTVGSVLIGIIILLVFLALAGNAMGFLKLDFLTGGKRDQTEAVSQTTEAVSADTVKVPNLLGKKKEEAMQLLNSVGLGGQYGGEKESTDYNPGEIMEQTPAAGSDVAKNTTITYYISKGEVSIPLPDLSGYTLSAAQETLRELQLRSNTEYENSSEVPEGSIISTNPGAETLVNVGDTITLIVSKGAETEGTGETVRMPDVVGSPLQDAIELLESLGFYVNVSENFSDEYDEDMVMNQDIEVGTMVAKGITINLQVSVGSEEAANNVTDQNEMGTYACNVDLKMPGNYNSEKVKIVLEQDGKVTTLVENESIVFPYRLSHTSDSDGFGTAYIYITNADGSITPVRYDDIPFKRVN